MPNLDLSTLSGPELRRLLDAARGRGQAAQSYQILQEMAERRRRQERTGVRPLLKRRPEGLEPRVIALDLGDPLEPRDEPLLRAEEALEPEEEPSQLDLSLERAPRAQPRRAPWIAMAFVAGVSLGGAGGWWMGGINAAPAPAPSDGLTPEAVAAELAGLQVEAAPEPLPQPAAAAVAEPVTLPTEPAPQVAEETPAETPAASDPAPTETVTADACAGASTPADRAICADPELQRLQGELRQAYARALEAHEERGLLRERQLAWAQARDGVSDPDRLAQMYQERIRRLDAATADASRRR